MGFASSPIFADLGLEITGASLDEIDGALLRAAIARAGVVRLRGFAVDQAAFIALSARISSRAIAHSLGAVRHRLREDGTVVAPLPGNAFVDLHGEMYFFPRHPDLVWFWCERPPERGGATTVADGAAFLRALSPEARDELDRRRLQFSVHMSADGVMSLGETTDLERAMANVRAMPGVIGLGRRAGGYALEYTTVAIVGDVFINSIMNVRRQGTTIRVRFADGGEIEPTMIAELAEVGERLTRDLEWQTGDIVVMDNAQVIHGRRAFDGDRAIQIRHTML